MSRRQYDVDDDVVPCKPLRRHGTIPTIVATPHQDDHPPARLNEFEDFVGHRVAGPLLQQRLRNARRERRQ